ncbi:MAG TPA: alpha/beta hydrolase [Micromonosporaceae bacterium]|jgi:pimeloyl-ACP methyl ester carboxylesterase
MQVGPHEIAFKRYGDGTPTVVILPGFGADAAVWEPIATAVAATTSVLTYDRPPYGSTGAARDRRTPDQIAAELAGLLDALDIKAPVVLVAHSAGGRYARRFAMRYPDRMAGLVLVDSSHEDQVKRLLPRFPLRMRLQDRMTPLAVLVDRSRSWPVRRSTYREFRSFDRQSAADALPPGALGDLPLIVITRAQPADAKLAAGWRAWRGLHLELAATSTDHRHLIASTDEHNIHLHQPDLVLDAIDAVIQSVRAAVPLSASGDDAGAA